jgi:hypothetical protein
MEDTKRKRDRVLTVERRYEWSRLEGRLMASAYEYILPIVQSVPGRWMAERPNLGSGDRDRATNEGRLYATGA